MRLNELETNYHDLQLKFDEMRTKERSKAKEDIEKLSKEKGLELEVQKQQLSVRIRVVNPDNLAPKIINLTFRYFLLLFWQLFIKFSFLDRNRRTLPTEKR
jgi:hypothetical protein